MTALQQDYRNAQQVPNRRGFMVGAAGLTFGFSLGLLETGTPVGNGVAQAATGNGAVMNPWVTIASDGTVAIISPATEMGQGSTTITAVDNRGRAGRGLEQSSDRAGPTY